VKQPQKTLLLWVVVIVSLLAVWQLLGPQGATRQAMDYSEFIEMVQAQAEDKTVERRIVEVKIRDRDYAFEVRDANGKSEHHVTVGPPDADPSILLKSGLKVKYEKDDGGTFWMSALTIMLPMLFLLVMFYLFMRQLQAGGGKAMSFGKSRARLLNEAQNKVTFVDVAGVDEANAEVEDPLQADDVLFVWLFKIHK
jgi:cell division protease FtsH